MTRKRWTTDAQEEWLKARIAAFLEAHQNKKLAKEFFPVVLKEFRDKWPVLPLTTEETAAAPTAEQAMKIKRQKYDQRTRNWFHNNTRTQTSQSSGSGSQAILKINSKQKILQPWQAYQALTYESQWKPDVDEAWDDYVATWNTEHPDEKPEKKRLVFLMEFMKEKLAAETDEIKERVEQYRVSRKDESPAPVDSDHDKNLQIQSAIDKIPRTLATIGESIMQQTGWHVTILCGGPAPDVNGQIMAFLAHHGKTKDGLTFEKFLGPSEYDEHLLVPFEKFLHNCFTENSRGKEKEDIVDEMEGEDEGRDIEMEGEHVEKVAKNKNKEEGNNIANLEVIVGNLKAKYAIPDMADNLKSKTVLPKVVSMKDGGGDKQSSSGISIATTSTTPFVTAALPTDEIAVSTKSTEASETRVAPTPPKRERGNTPAIQHDHILSDNVLTTSTGNNLPVIIQPAASATTVEPTPPGEEITASTQTTGAKHATDNSKTPSVGVSDSPAINCIDASATTVELMPPSEEITATKHATNNFEIPPVGVSDSPAIDCIAAGEDDVDMGNPELNDSEVCLPQDDDNLPPWLTQTIEYLRGVSDENAWQNLVTEFITFEKSGPPAGKLSITSRPREVDKWIKSKKKDSVPSIIPGRYGPILMKWWKGLQPSWRSQGDGILGRNMPTEENWPLLRKGGTAGIYTVIMGLSWWIKAQAMQRDADSWIIVDDLTWVIHQMHVSDATILSTSARPKRHREEDTDEAKRRFTRRCIYFPYIADP